MNTSLAVDRWMLPNQALKLTVASRVRCAWLVVGYRFY